MPRNLWSRRGLLRAGLVAGAAAGLGVRGRADVGSNRRFLFVLANGGWDTTRVFTPMLDSPRIAPEPGAAVVTQGDLTWVDHPDRPHVRAFFERAGDRVAVLDGILIRSINHRVCVRLIQTGGADPDAPDWASILGAAAGGDHALPTVVIDGPSSPGPLQRTTAVIGRPDQFQGLIDGDAYRRGDVEVVKLYPNAQARVTELVRASAEHRLAAEPDPGWRRVLEAEVDALARAEQLRLDAQDLRLASGVFEGQLDSAVDLLAADVSRCACVAIGNFDTHTDNADQGGLYEELFAGLSHLLDRLETTPGRTATTLGEETVVVVLSEMGRTPYLNETGGTDHWPYTAAMLFGPGVRGGVRLGGYDDFLLGQPMDLATGEVRSGGTVLTPGNLGATLLTLGGVDPGLWVPDGVVGALLG
jgi:uncharacterized protein (DUF1501 family)